ncbi:MAG: hypothetical protein H7Y43_05150 [Akkermansiaceae bacterium]|nr:hypothetical protein [Verrucomicrobiales bacterium]
MKKRLFKRLAWGNLVALTILAGSGCGKSKAPEPIAEPAVTQENAVVPTSPKPKIVPMDIAPPAGPDFGPLLEQLTQAARRYSVERRQVPKSVEDLVTAGYLTRVPPAPTGKQFVINPKSIEVTLKSR